MKNGIISNNHSVRKNSSAQIPETCIWLNDKIKQKIRLQINKI